MRNISYSRQWHILCKARKERALYFFNRLCLVVHAALVHGRSGFVLSGVSATIASVVRRREAMEAAFSSAQRVTFVGSRIPAFIMSVYSPVRAL